MNSTSDPRLQADIRHACGHTTTGLRYSPHEAPALEALRGQHCFDCQPFVGVQFACGHEAPFYRPAEWARDFTQVQSRTCTPCQQGLPPSKDWPGRTQ